MQIWTWRSLRQLFQKRQLLDQNFKIIQLNFLKKFQTERVHRATGEAAPAEAAEGDAVVDDDEDATEAPVDGPVDAPAKRQSRQFNAHVRMSSCSDEGLSYVCETK